MGDQVSQHSQASLLEATGQWQQALQLHRQWLRAGAHTDAETFHGLGRLLQRLGQVDAARRAYVCALQLDTARPRTCNNLALLELSQLNADRAEHWLLRGLALQPLSVEDEDLLQATACDLRLYQLRPEQALAHVDQQLRRHVSVMALANRAVCLHKLARLQEAVQAQDQAIALHLQEHAPALAGRPLPELVGVPCPDLHHSMQLQTQLMNLGIYRLCIEKTDPLGQSLLMAGTSNDLSFWQDPRRAQSRWQGQACDELIVWDDQGFGDTLQNLGWIQEAARRVKRLRVWLRPSLLPLVRARLHLPVNCHLEAMEPQACPWAAGVAQIGFFFLPVVLDHWLRPSDPPRGAYLQQKPAPATGCRIGLVWSAGRHKAPQPERSARVRDVPRQAFFQLADQWRQRFAATLVSLQLEGHDQAPVQQLIQAGILEQPLKSPDWLQTAAVIDSLDLLVSVDTSVAHLAGAMGLPTVMVLSSPADWRWGQSGERTVLYDSLRLARCARPGDWQPALEQADRLVAEILSRSLSSGC